MFLLHSFLWYSVLCLNVWETHKCLKPPRAATRHRPARNVGNRKRQTKAQLALWVVWILYTFIESFADKTVSYLVPFYSELKMGILLWMLASRTLGSNFVYTNFISPTLTLYSTPLDLLFSLVYELSEAIIWLLAFPFNRLRAALGFSSSTDDTGDGDLAGEETSLTPRTVVRRAKKIYEEIERHQKMERPGMVKARTASGAGAKKDPRLRERKMVLEKQAREKAERELEEEVEEMARVEREESSAKVGGGGASSLDVPQPQTNVSRTSSSSSSSSGLTGVLPRPSLIDLTQTATTVRRGPSAAPRPNAIASSSSSSFTRPTTIRPSSNLNPSKSQPTASSSRLPLGEPSSSFNLSSSSNNTLPSTSSSSSTTKPSPLLLPTPTSTSNASSSSSSQTALQSPMHPFLAAARSSLRSSTPPTQHASIVVPPTPMPPGAFNFHPTFQPQQQQPSLVSFPLPTAQQPSPPPPAAISPPRKRKNITTTTSSPPNLRATPARKAKSKALLELTHSHSHLYEEGVELEEREGTEDEEGEGGKKNRRRRRLVFEERDEIEEDDDEEKEGGEERRDGKGKGKGKGKEKETAEVTMEDVEEKDTEEEVEPQPKPTRRAFPSKRTTPLTRPAPSQTTRNPTTTATSSLRNPSAPPTSTRSTTTTRGVGPPAASTRTRTRIASAGPAAVAVAAAASGRRRRVLSDESVEVVDGRAVLGTTRGRVGRAAGGKVVGS